MKEQTNKIKTEDFGILPQEYSGETRRMANHNRYDVTDGKFGDPFQDIGVVINGIIADIKLRQNQTDFRNGGKPGALIYIPPGDYPLRTQVHIDISYLKIAGSGHGFTSSSIRFNTPKEELAHWHELWPGGSRILVDLPDKDKSEQSEGAAFLVDRTGNPRLSSVEFADFCIDGLHFFDKSSASIHSENSYRNGKTGIYVASANDSFRITGMGIVYLEHGITVFDADAMTVDNNFVAECGNCIQFKGMGQASTISNNLVGAGFEGHSIYVEKYGGILVSANNVFPRGASSIHFSGVARSSISGNRLHSFYPGMLILSDDCTENLVSGNHFLRDCEPWEPMKSHDNSLDDQFGLMYIDGSSNSVIANHVSLSIGSNAPTHSDMKPVIIRVVGGLGNYIATNHIVATTNVEDQAHAPVSACFSTQVGAILSTKKLKPLKFTAVLVEESSTQNIVLDCGSDEQVEMNRNANALRILPQPGQ